MAVREHPKDVCECGDYRHQHAPNGGACHFNRPEGIGHGAAADCAAFRLFRYYGATHIGSLSRPVIETE